MAARMIADTRNTKAARGRRKRATNPERYVDLGFLGELLGARLAALSPRGGTT